MVKIVVERWGSEPHEPPVAEFESLALVAKAKAALVALVLLVALYGMPYLIPHRVADVFPWSEGECWWFNGTVEDKWMEKHTATTNYKFLVNGTLDNSTEISMVFTGGFWDYEYYQVGMRYEGFACDTVTLREAVVAGTLEIILWASGD